MDERLVVVGGTLLERRGVQLTQVSCRHPLPFPCAFVPRDEEMDAQKLASLIHGSNVEFKL